MADLHSYIASCCPSYFFLPAETNSIYWPWYCNQTDFWARLLKGILQGALRLPLCRCTLADWLELKGWPHGAG